MQNSRVSFYRAAWRWLILKKPNDAHFITLQAKLAPTFANALDIPTRGFPTGASIQSADGDRLTFINRRCVSTAYHVTILSISHR